jgi:hypothetical protein
MVGSASPAGPGKHAYDGLTSGQSITLRLSMITSFCQRGMVAVQPEASSRGRIFAHFDGHLRTSLSKLASKAHIICAWTAS